MAASPHLERRLAAMSSSVTDLTVTGVLRASESSVIDIIMPGDLSRAGWGDRNDGMSARLPSSAGPASVRTLSA